MLTSADARTGAHPMITLTVNEVSRNIDADPDTPLLWVIREWLA
jgi:aerobic-type carbon monoxide dehydrogenase small subunit (CoxS/CutS family)